MMTQGTALLPAPTIAPLGDDPRRILGMLREAGFRAVQFSATMPRLKPRELDQSARRDILATLRRNELALAGIDLWIPIEHYTDPAHVEQALETSIATIELASDLQRCPVSLSLPTSEDESDSEVIDVITTHAAKCGVELADHGEGKREGTFMGVGIDPAAWLARDQDPAAGVMASAGHLVSARLCDLLRSGMRGPLGSEQEGRLDVMAYHVALNVINYQRPVVLDARQWSEPWEGLRQSAKVWMPEGMEP